ncbi:hypothetical protein ILYODFUR_030319 [Ilyodon furcidens]|uniref:Secreted protein n=1 Tax=Ilyodon furcidens TaxID=33524 RepID=A0ABV0TP47_9TELE
MFFSCFRELGPPSHQTMTTPYMGRLKPWWFTFMLAAFQGPGCCIEEPCISNGIPPMVYLCRNIIGRLERGLATVPNPGHTRLGVLYISYSNYFCMSGAVSMVSNHCHDCSQKDLTKQPRCR